MTTNVPDGYAEWLSQLKGDIAKARQRAALTVNAALVQLYHRIGGGLFYLSSARMANFGSSLLPNCPGSIRCPVTGMLTEQE